MESQGGDVDKVSNLQRAFWTFLAYTLIGPFLAGLGVAAAVILAPILQLSPLLPAGLPNAGIAAVLAFVWSALPAAIAGLAMFALVWRTGGFGALSAAAAGVAGFGIALAFSNMPYREYLVALAFFAALVSLGVRYALMTGNILKDGSGG